MNQDQFEHDVSSQEWEYEKRYKDGTDYLFRHDPDYYVWLEQRRKEDSAFQIVEESN